MITLASVSNFLHSIRRRGQGHLSVTPLKTPKWSLVITIIITLRTLRLGGEPQKNRSKAGALFLRFNRPGRTQGRFGAMPLERVMYRGEVGGPCLSSTGSVSASSPTDSLQVHMGSSSQQPLLRNQSLIPSQVVVRALRHIPEQGELPKDVKPTGPWLFFSRTLDSLLLGGLTLENTLNKVH